MKKLIIFLLSVLFLPSISAEKYTLRFSKEYFGYMHDEFAEEYFKSAIITICLPDALLSNQNYRIMGIVYNEVGVTNEVFSEESYALPIYVLDTLDAQYDVEKFNYKVNKKETIDNNVILMYPFIPGHDPEPTFHDPINFENDGFPNKTLVKYGFHSKKGRNVFFISPFIYNPKTRVLKLATELTLNVKLRLKSNVYVGAEGIHVETESDERQNVRIYDVSGRLVYSADFVRNITIDRSGFDKGVYIVHLTEPNGNSRNIKIVI